MNVPVTRQQLREMARRELKRRERIAARKETAERDLMTFIRMFWRVVEPATPLVEGWALDLICETLMAVTDGHLTRVCINVPPGFMKSMALNVFWPAWEWGPQGMSHLRYLSASYSTALPERDNERLLRVISDPIYQMLWGDKFSIERAGLTLIQNDKTGSKRVISTGSGTTGHRGDRILCDDLNDPNTVESDTVRNSTAHWVREVMPDRLNNLVKSAIINIQQRTHQQDATGVLAEHMPDLTWISIPMEFDPLRISRVTLRRDENGDALQTWTDPRALDANGEELEGLQADERGKWTVRMGSPMAQAEGTLAWPERFPPAAVHRLKTIKGDYAWAGQYQQSPTVRGGAIIRSDWWNVWGSDYYPTVGTVIVSVDTAIKESEENDYNAVTVWGAFAGDGGEPQLMLMDAWHERMSLSELVARVARTCGRWKADYLLIEDKARGHDVAAEIQRLYERRSWQTVLIKVAGGVGAQDKQARLRAVSGLFSGDIRSDPLTGIDTWAGGIIWAPDTEWADVVIDQVTNFPRSAHDDYVDSISQALAWMRRNGVAVRAEEHRHNEEQAQRYRPTPGVPYAIAGRNARRL